RLYFIVQNLRAVWCALLGIALLLVAWLYVRALFKPSDIRPSAAMAALSIVTLQSALWLTLVSAIAIPLIRQAELHKLPTCSLQSLYVSFTGTALLLAIVGFVALLTFLSRYFLSR